MKNFMNKIKEHPLGALYGTLLGFIAFFAALPMFASGAWDAALVDLIMALILIGLILKKVFSNPSGEITLPEKCVAYLLLFLADILVLLPMHNLAGHLSTAGAFAILLCAVALYFGGKLMAVFSLAPALWCCVFMPYHEEIMLLLSFPLRLSATMLSGAILNLFKGGIVYSGTTLTLPGVDIAITDACSGISQLDAFILLAFVAVQILHRRTVWKVLHFAFMIPAVIAGNSLRIVLTVVLYRLFGETVFANTWHTVLGYTQIVFALLIYWCVGRIFVLADKKTEEENHD